MLVGLCKKLVDHTTHNRGIRVGQALMNVLSYSITGSDVPV
jgi:hypothetical protein